MNRKKCCVSYQAGEYKRVIVLNSVHGAKLVCPHCEKFISWSPSDKTLAKRAKMKIPFKEKICKFGKHSGKTWSIIIEEDRNYIDWLMCQSWLFDSVKNNLKMLLEQ